jgi:SAM-dependent methyltransferase
VTTGPGARLRLRLFAVSFLALFVELALIRYINSTVQVIAYFNNFLILSAFLGLGVGSSLAGSRRGLFRLLPLALPSVMTLLALLDRFGVESGLTDIVYWASGAGVSRLSATPVMLLVFCANCAVFIPIGNQLGATLAEFENRLEAYSIDLLGSLAGVLAFTAVSFLGTQPWTWFALAAAVALWLLADGAGPLRIPAYAVGLAAGVGLTLVPSTGVWSPYYKVEFVPYRTEQALIGYGILVDKLRIQDALAFTPELARTSLAGWIPYYQLPYEIRRPRRVLILGGGSGNDTAMALRYGADQIDVVEIDPVLVGAGSWLHPERPYRDPRVRVVTDDARAFLRRADRQYDLVVMNALDSHHQLPGLSTLRLESFIYTVEAFRDVRRRLTPESLFVVHLSSTREWMGQRLFASLVDAFGEEPRLLTTAGSPFQSVAFALGPRAVLDGAGGMVVPVTADVAATIRAGTRRATDDWPHLYLRTNAVPGLYVKLLALIVVFAGVLLYGSARRLGEARNLHFCLLGAGFMLLETRSITQAALLFGSTWIVNGVVIGAILLVIWLGNRRLQGGVEVPKPVAYLGLFATLVAGYAVAPTFILEFGFAARVALATLWFGAPVFFASLVFSHSFRDVGDTARAFGANLLGVVIGGVLEYSSMVFGLNALYLIAIGIYLLALVAERAGVPKGAEAVPAR